MREIAQLSDDGLDFWVYYGRHVQVLIEEAEKAGVPLWTIRHVPVAAAKYAEQVVSEMRRCQNGSAWLRRRNFYREARRFEKRVTWRGEIPDLAESFRKTLDALAKTEVVGTVGSPRRKLGASRIAERKYVNRALVELTKLANAQGHPEFIREFLKPCVGNKLSPGRALVAKRAMKLADADGVLLSKSTLSAQIRERAKAPATHVNPLALYGYKLARKSRPKKRPLIKARFS